MNRKQPIRVELTPQIESALSTLHAYVRATGIRGINVDVDAVGNVLATTETSEGYGRLRAYRDGDTASCTGPWKETP